MRSMIKRMNIAVALMGMFTAARAHVITPAHSERGIDISIKPSRYGSKDHKSTSRNRLSQQKRRIQARRRASH